MIALEIMFVVSGSVLAAISVPLILRRIPPNGLYGFRVRKTMEHPEIWYPVNKYGGQRLLLSSLLLILAAIGFPFIPNLRIDTYSYAVLVVWVVGSSIRDCISLPLYEFPLNYIYKAIRASSGRPDYYIWKSTLTISWPRTGRLTAPTWSTLRGTSFSSARLTCSACLNVFHGLRVTLINSPVIL